MLILTRWVREAIIIDGCVRVEVLNVRGRQVRLGITAPKDVPVHREEIFDELVGEGRIEHRPRHDDGRWRDKL